MILPCKKLKQIFQLIYFENNDEKSLHIKKSENETLEFGMLYDINLYCSATISISELEKFQIVNDDEIFVQNEIIYGPYHFNECYLKKLYMFCNFFPDNLIKIINEQDDNKIYTIVQILEKPDDNIDNNLINNFKKMNISESIITSEFIIENKKKELVYPPLLKTPLLKTIIDNIKKMLEICNVNGQKTIINIDSEKLLLIKNEEENIVTTSDIELLKHGISNKIILDNNRSKSIINILNCLNNISKNIDCNIYMEKDLPFTIECLIGKCIHRVYSIHC